MSKELEVKVININKEEIENRLKEVGAKLVKKEFQINTIFDTDDRIIKYTHNGYLRIRESRDQINNRTECIFTLKKNVSNDGIRENIEIESKIEDKEAIKKILRHLGLTVKHEGIKERISYSYEDILFDIDTWDKNTYPEPYLEIEVVKKEDLEKAIKLLGLDRNNVTDKSLAKLRMEKGLGDL